MNTFEMHRDAEAESLLLNHNPEALNEWLLKLLFVQLQSLSVSALDNDPLNFEAVVNNAGVLPQYKGWWQESINQLQMAGFIKTQAGQADLDSEMQLSREKIWESWEKYKAKNIANEFKTTEFKSAESQAKDVQINLLEACLRQLPEILRGQIQATEVLFPDSSVGKVEGIYKNNAVSDYFNRVVTDVVTDSVEKRIAVDANARIRIVEIGAGTGGTTAMVLPRLLPYISHIQEYVYTDISRAFLLHARENYGPGCPFLAYELWDIEKPLATQKIPPGVYDIAIATNVLHATKDIRVTLRNAKSALRQNGILVINELSDKSLFTHLTFGLLKGWWLHEDSELRIPGSPAIDPHTWQDVLEEEGYRCVEFPAAAAHPLGQQIVVAQSDGVIRQSIIRTETPKESENRTGRPSATQPVALEREQHALTSSDHTREALADMVLVALAQTVNISSAQIDPDVPFSEYGIDSILNVNFINQVSNSLGISMNPAVIYDYATVNALSGHIYDAYKELQREVRPQRRLDPRPDKLAVTEAKIHQPLAADIAVIGMSGQFPGAADVDAFWQNLLAGESGIVELPADYLDLEKYYSTDSQDGKTYCKWGGILKERDCFDPLFFNITPQDAESMSPHQRIILQESWKALEDAGYNPKTLADTAVSIYIGAEPSGYHRGSFVGSSDAIIASRLSYYLNLKGPAMVVNTGCSSSAVAIHLACESLRNNESGMALAGGVFAALDSGALVSMSGVGMLTSKAGSPVFDESADGMLLSEGAGIVVLKRLQAAIADRDPIYGLIKGSGVNQDGASNGITAPSGTAQQQLLASVYEKFNIDPETISYFEAHATGGRLGDTIEVNALTRAFAQFTDKRHYCALGSVKTHIGHTSAASGVIGLIKILLSLRHRKIPGLLHYKKPNPLFELDKSAFYIHSDQSDWNPIQNKPLAAALNSFGHSGTNAHFVVEEFVPYPPAQTNANRAGLWLIPLSAKSKESLKAVAEKLRTFLESASSDTSALQIDMNALAYTLQVGREPMKERLVILSRSIADCIRQLQCFLKDEAIEYGWTGQPLAENKKKAAPFTKDNAYGKIAFNQFSVDEFAVLARSWVEGCVVDWEGFYGQDKPHRINLPTYAFAKEIHRPAETAQPEAYGEPEPENASPPGNDEYCSYPIGLPGYFDSSNPWTEAFDHKHSILKNHRAFGQELIPGLAYIDLLYQFFRKKGFDYRTLEMRNLSIYHPLTVGKDYAVRAQILCHDTGEGYWKIRVEGWETGINRPQSAVKVFIAAEMHLTAPHHFAETIDFNAIRATSRNGILLQDAYQEFGGEAICHTGPMVGAGKIHRLASANFIDISVPDEQLDNADQYMFHPVLIDGSAIGSGDLFTPENGSRDIFLPLYYESFRASELMQKNCITRIKRSSLQRKKQLSYLTMEFFKPSGEKIGELKNFTCKLVRDPTSINPNYAASKQKIDEQVRVSDTTESGAPSDALEVVENFLKNALASVLGKTPDEIDTDIGYYELGLDSALLLEVVTGLEKKLSVKLNPTLLFEYTTVCELAEYLFAHYREKFAFTSGLQAAAGDPQKAAPVTTAVSVAVPEPAARSAAVSRLERHEPVHGEDIAVIGLSGRYPGANDIRVFWDNLKEGKDSVTEISAARWQRTVLDGLQSPSGKALSKWGGFLEDVDCFDPQFFRVSPLEAQLLDPQERLFLETCWATIEDAGYTPETLVSPQGLHKRREVGVFVGVMHKDYALIGAEAVGRGETAPLSLNYAPIANRVSYFCGFHGPSLAVDTVCSSSLTAIHLAIQSVRHGECRLALAGGVNLSLHPYKYLTYGLADMYSSDGRCRAFGAGGDGFVSSEGVGAVLLKPLHQAIEDDDHIYAVTKGSTINHVGNVSGITVPNPVAQADMILRCFEKTGIDPRTISYVEAHGTGTSLGDPIEIQGLVKAFRHHTADKQFCSIGSVKSNIGHAESAAGISGLTKVILQLHHKTLVPSLHSDKVNPYIDLESSPFYIQRKTQPWQQPVIAGEKGDQVYPRRAGISSFGATGSNAHVILEEYVSHKVYGTDNTSQPEPVVVPLSAKSEDRLKALAGNLRQYLQTGEEISFPNMDDLAYTLQVGRKALEERVAFVVDDRAELIQKLDAFVADKEPIERSWRGRGKAGERDTGFMAAEDTREMIARWVAQGALQKIARFWVEGFSFDWKSLYGEEKPRRVSLPTYPFARERYWISTATDIGTPMPADIAAKEPARESAHRNDPEQEAPALMTFEESWQQVSLPALTSVNIGTLVCFLSNPDNQRVFADGIQALGSNINVVFVAQGPAGEPRSPHCYGVARWDAESYQNTLKHIGEAHGAVDAMLYLWPLEDAGCIRDYSCLVHILQAIASTKLAPASLIFSGEFANDLDRCYLESWVGIERSLAQLLPDTQVAVMFRGGAAHSDNVLAPDWVSTLCRELQADKIQSVFYDAQKRHVLRVQTGALTEMGNSRVKNGGTYLITGGCGGLGLLFARHLAGTYAANLILTGRSAVDHNKQQLMDTLAELGGRAVYIQADVCDVESMRAGLAKARQDFGPMQGVIHAAGLEPSAPVFEKDYTDFQNILAPKIKGTLVLDELLREEPLDFVCYFSSSAAILGDFGSCDYAIGNRFQMAYGKFRDARRAKGVGSGKTLVINWPFWKEGGMGIGDESSIDFYLKSSGQRALETHEGLEIFEKLLRQKNIQHLILSGKPSRMHQFLGLPPAPAVPSKTSLPPESSNASAQRSQPEVISCTSLKGLTVKQRISADLKAQVSALLKTPADRLTGKTNLADFGFDSISLAAFARSLTNHYGMDVTPSLFFGHSTLEQLTQYFWAEHRDAMQAFYRQSATGDRSVQAEPVLSPLSVKRPEQIEMSSGLEPKQQVDEPIAVIGMSGRFPQADTVAEFWENLLQGKNCIGEISDQRWNWREIHEAHNGVEEVVPKWGAFMKDIDQFDPLFFEITPREAMDMDPRQRVFLEEAWHTFEDAGYMGRRIQGMSCGVYVGVEEGDYGALVGKNGSINGNQNATLAARIAYTLDLKGPNFALTAACASGLVAVHQACLALRQGDCDMALAGGVNLLLTPWVYLSMSRTGMLSADGTAQVFDQRANGLVPGEAVAVVLLKPLSRAVADGDRIYGCIKASGVNYDGKTNGITAPNPLRQADLLKSVYTRYRIDPRAIQYVLSHSTGSQLGDPIEVQALHDVFSQSTSDTHYCTLGSIKPLIGHTFAASGVVNLIAMLQALKHQTIPATAQYEMANRYIDFKRSPFVVNRENQPWKRMGHQPRLGTISATGISGTNAHAVIEEYIPGDPATVGKAFPENEREILPLSAKTPHALNAYAQAFIQWLKDEPECSLSSLAYSLQTGREAMDKRVVFLVSSIAEFKEALQAFVGGRESVGVYSGEKKTDADIDAWDLESHPELESLMGRWLENRELESLANAWTQGADIDWLAFYERRPRPRRVGIPVYPFQRKRYWVRDTTPASTAGRENTAIQSATRPEEQVHHEITHRIRALLMQSMCFEEDEIQANKTFSELGLNSVNAISFIKEINSAFSLSLTPQSIFEHPSLEALSFFIGQGGIEQGQNLPVSKENTIQNRKDDNSVKPPQDSSGGVGNNGLKRYPECISLHGNGTKKPCFWIHPLTGSAGLYLKIAESLGADQPFCALQSRGLLTQRQPYNNIEDMARYYIDIIQACDGQGPYQLAGYSMGGVIAYEMAKQLQSSGCEVSSLILLEPPFPEPGHNRNNNAFQNSDALLMSANFFLHYSLKDESNESSLNVEDFAFRESDLNGLAEAELPRALAAACIKKGVKQPLEVAQHKIENMALILRLNREALASYQVASLPRPENIDVHYITILQSRYAASRAEDKFTALADSNRSVLGEDLTHNEAHFRKWERFLPGVQVCRTSARDHFHLLAERKSIAMIVEKCRAVYEAAGRVKHHNATHSSREPQSSNRDIAIIGMSGRFPGGKNLDDFWGLLKMGQTAFTELPRNRGWAFDDIDSDNRHYARYGGFLDDIDHFDPIFFQISPNEAMMLDPCERLFLQEAWRAIEDAGIDPTSLSGQRWGVLCGSSGDYALRFANGESVPPNITLSQVPGRVSYCLNLTGPCQSVEAGCASSLLAVAQACDHLVLEKCDVAIAGGALIYSTPNMLISSSRIGLLSNAERACAFDADARGMMPGESVGVLILKPLADAVADGDRIHGVIEGWGNNHNGKTNGMLSPSETSQAALFSEVYRRFHINPETISMVEAHAAGMPLSDATEIKALTEAFRKKTEKRRYCVLGSVENNIGHAFHGSGISHLMKVLLAMKHREIPATLNIETPNPALDLEDGPFFINSETLPWQVEPGQARRAAVSSFGATGANVHLVIAEPPERPSHSGASQFAEAPVLVALSAKSESAFMQRCRELIGFLKMQENLDLKQLSANLLLRRSHFSWRCALVVSNREELKQQLAKIVEGKDIRHGYTGTVDTKKTAGPSETLLALTKAKKVIDDSRFRKENLLALAELYVEGVPFDLSDDFSGQEKYPLSIPGYPFDKRSCWIKTLATQNSSHPQNISGESKKIHRSSVSTNKIMQASDSVLEQLNGFLMEMTGLSRDEIDRSGRLSDYGIDSLQGLRLLNRINSAFDVEFDVYLLMKETISDMADEISQVARNSSARTAFIHKLRIDIDEQGRAITSKDREQAHETLGLLIAQGIGLWKDNGVLWFEYYKGTHDARSIKNLVTFPEALWAILDEAKRYYPASHIQKFILHETEVKHRARFNIGQGFWIEMPVNLALLNQAFSDIVKHHSVLRTGAQTIAGQWIQVVHDSLTVQCREVSWPEIATKQQFEWAFEAFQKERTGELFDVNRAPMLDVYLIHNEKDLAVIYFVTHHFHADGFTLFLFQQELYHRYQALKNNQRYASSTPLAEYAHFALCQFGADRDEATDYWVKNLQGKRSNITLKDRAYGVSEVSEKAGALALEIPTEMLQALQKCNQRHNTTLTQLVTCAVATLVYRLTGENMPVQMVYNLRDRYEFETVYGDFSSSVPMILDIKPHFSLKEVFGCYESASLQIQKHKRFDFLELQKQLTPEGEDPLESSLLGSISIDSNDRDTFVEVTDFAERLIAMPIEDRMPVAPLLVCLLKTYGRMSLTLMYDQKCFARETIQLLADAIIELLDIMVEKPDTLIGELNISPELEYRLSPDDEHPKKYKTENSLNSEKQKSIC